MATIFPFSLNSPYAFRKARRSSTRRPTLVKRMLMHLWFSRAKELFHRRMSRLADTLALQDLPPSEGKDFQVQPERHVVNIPNVQLEFLFPSQGISTFT